MKKIITILLLLQISFLLISEESYYEKPLSFNSARILGMGNTFVANANGLESFEFNPAGIAGDKSFTLLNGNFNLISNLFQLGDDLVESYNESEGTSKTEFDFADISFYLDPENRLAIIGALLNQATVPYEGFKDANGLGFTSALSMGYVGNGFGLGLLVSFDSEVFGEELFTTELNSVLTTSLLVGYAMSIDLGIIGLDVGVAARPMYKIRTSSSLTPVVNILLDDSDSEDSLLADLDYQTGFGLGIDVGVKARFMGLTAGLSLIDLFSTTIQYTEISYDELDSGQYFGTEDADEYITPTTLKVGLAFNPGLGNFSKVFNPTIALDYSVLFIEDGQLDDYAVQGSFWENFSVGTEIELFSFTSLRAGLNQGYLTGGLGLKLFIVDINFAIYSKELGEEVGERQQMGAVLEFGIKL